MRARKSSRMAVIGRLAGPMLIVSCASSAQAATYVNRADFLSALTTPTTADFNALGDGFYGGPGFGGTGTLTYNGITVSTSTSYLFSSGGNTYGTGSTIGAQQFSPTVVDFTISGLSTAFGFNYNAQTPITLTVAGETYLLPATSDDELGFFGVTTLTAFSTAQTSTTGSGSGIGIDNVTFDIAAAPGVPEPATWLTMLLGFGVIGATLRRKQSVRIKFAFA